MPADIWYCGSLVPRGKRGSGCSANRFHMDGVCLSVREACGQVRLGQVIQGCCTAPLLPPRRLTAPTSSSPAGRQPRDTRAERVAYLVDYRSRVVGAVAGQAGSSSGDLRGCCRLEPPRAIGRGECAGRVWPTDAKWAQWTNKVGDSGIGDAAYGCEYVARHPTIQ